MPVDPIFDAVFKDIYGKPCWRVTPGHGSFLTLEFGNPHLEIREPITPRENTPQDVGEDLQSRRVSIHGDWHLWIYCCNWRVLRENELVGDSSSDSRIQRAADYLDGQKLVQFSIQVPSVQCVFAFDLGACLETRPYDHDSEQWLFFDQRASKVLTLRADGFYSYHRSDQAGEEEWLPIQV
ncbi:MAG TPA: hypothetical protein VFR84_14385 [Candidatus Angelobacter sp.]|nr:hypothetical protein [Candidatus Angelobacter sp.]